MHRHIVSALLASAFGVASASAGPLSLSTDQSGVVRTVPTQGFAAAAQPSVAAAQSRYANNGGQTLGGGFIEFLFGGERQDRRDPADRDGQAEPHSFSSDPGDRNEPARSAIDPKYLRHVIDYSGAETTGTDRKSTRLNSSHSQSSYAV